LAHAAITSTVSWPSSRDSWATRSASQSTNAGSRLGDTRARMASTWAVESRPASQAARVCGRGAELAGPGHEPLRLAVGGPQHGAQPRGHGGGVLRVPQLGGVDLADPGGELGLEPVPGPQQGCQVVADDRHVEALDRLHHPADAHGPRSTEHAPIVRRGYDENRAGSADRRRNSVGDRLTAQARPPGDRLRQARSPRVSARLGRCWPGRLRATSCCRGRSPAWRPGGRCGRCG
jgi:hypothetical protein